MARRRRYTLIYGVALVVILLLAISPILAALGSSLIARTAGCQVNEAASHACVIYGMDFGAVLQFFFVSGWFAFLTVPAGVVALGLWIVIALIHFIVRAFKRPA